eukprot:scaffold20341_cov12-Tisochrysis_lutea.AAC.1
MRSYDALMSHPSLIEIAYQQLFPYEAANKLRKCQCVGNAHASATRFACNELNDALLCLALATMTRGVAGCNDAVDKVML